MGKLKELAIDGLKITRYEEAKRLRDSGMTFKAVGAALSVSVSRARSLVEMQTRRERMQEARKNNPELYQRQTPWHEGLKYQTARELERAGFYSRDMCIALAADNLTMWRGSIALPGWEEDRSMWRWSRKKLSLAVVNEVRAWLAAPVFVPPSRVASAGELDRARRLLERHGWTVTPPNVGGQRSDD